MKNKKEVLFKILPNLQLSVLDCSLTTACVALLDIIVYQHRLLSDTLIAAALPVDKNIT